MKATYYAAIDSLYIELMDKPSADSREVAPETVLDFDEEGNVIGMEVYGDAARRVDLTEMRLERL